MIPPSDLTDPEVLAKMVRDGVRCGDCGGTAVTIGNFTCDTCSGTGRVPMSNADLEALAAKWCDSAIVEGPIASFDGGVSWWYAPQYTTSPTDAMRLQVKYDIETMPLKGNATDPDGAWSAGTWVGPEGEQDSKRVDVYVAYLKDAAEDEKRKALCRAITEAALIAALTEAMQATERRETSNA